MRARAPWALAAAGLGAWGALGAGSPGPMLQGYLAAWVFWAGLSTGCLGLVMLHHLVGGRWGASARARWEAGAAALPILALLFAPVALGLSRVYPWAREAPAHAAGYLNAPMFQARAALILGAWCALAWGLRRAPARALQPLSAGGLVLLLLTGTFAAIDWTMSLEPGWVSSLYGFDALVGHGCAALAFAAAARGGGDDPQGRHDLGNLLLAFVMLWAYLAYSQWLLVWSADLPREALWYLRRVSGGWGAVAALLAAFHFAVPFLVLLSREAKRRPGSLAAVGALVLGARGLDLLWRTAPALEPGALVLWAPAFAGLGGLWGAGYLRARGLESRRGG